MRVPLIGPQGIFKAAVLPDMPISIATAPVREGEPRPYDDGLDEQGLLSYRYRGTDPRHRGNVGLRLAMERRVPLIYLFGVVKGEYMPVWPVFIVDDDPSVLTFEVAIDDRQLGLLSSVAPTDQIAEARRSYVTALTVRRLHQTSKLHHAAFDASIQSTSIRKGDHHEGTKFTKRNILGDRHDSFQKA